MIKYEISQGSLYETLILFNKHLITLFLGNCFCYLHIIICLYLVDFPTCLLCTCISTTVYCDDHELDAIPPLPKNTAYFYSRFNRIKKINKNDFASLSMDDSINTISSLQTFPKFLHYKMLVLKMNLGYENWPINNSFLI